MAYNTKAIKTDVNGNPISQYYNSETDEYEPVEGAGGGNKVIIYNEDGTPNNSLNFGEILDKLDQLTGTVIAEQTRQQNEAIRQQNEQQRIDLYNALKDLDVSQYELRLQKLEHDTSVEEFILEEWDEPVIPLPSNATNGQINEIKIFGNTEAEEDNVKSTFGAIRLKSVNEDETKGSTLYILGRDEEGNILELRSLPNGVKDEINVSERKLIKRIEVKSNITSGTIINFTDMAEGGTYFAWNENGETETGTKGDTLGIDATVLIYQLAEPIEIPVEVFGSLQSYENGTVYVDAIIPRVDFYTPDGIYLENEPSIKEIDSLYLVNKETGLLTPLDISKAFIFPDGKGFTHPDLGTGILINWSYIPDVESTNPVISMALPTNLKASTNSSLSGIRDLSEKIGNLNIRVTAIQKDDISQLNKKILEVEDNLNRHVDDFDNHIADYNRLLEEYAIWKRIDTLSAPVQLTTDSTYDNPIIVPVDETPKSSNVYAIEFRIQSSDSRASQIAIFAGGTSSATGIFCGVDHEGNIYAARRYADAANKQFKFFGLVSPTGGTREVYISRIFRVK